MKQSAFCNWLDTFVEEKGLDLEFQFEVEGKDWGMNYIPLEIVLGAIKNTTVQEQAQINDMIVRIDFANGDVMDYFKHLAKAIAV